MAVSFFIIESLTQGSTHSIDPETLRFQINAHLRECQCTTTSKSRLAATATEVGKAFRVFSAWAGRFPQDDHIFLITSFHGKPPTEGHMGTAGLSAAHTSDTPSVVNWYEVMQGVMWHPNTTVLVDSCWGGSPTFASRASGTTRPSFVFGPTRPASAIEMGTARHLLVSFLAKHQTLNCRHAKKIVDILNSIYVPNEKGAPFFGVWMFESRGRNHFVRYPDTSRKVRRSSQ